MFFGILLQGARAYCQHTICGLFTKDVNARLTKRPLKTNGRLANRGLTSLVKATERLQYTSVDYQLNGKTGQKVLNKAPIGYAVHILDTSQNFYAALNTNSAWVSVSTSNI